MSLTRNQRRQRLRRCLAALAALLFLAAGLFFLLPRTASAAPAGATDNGRLPGDDIPASAACFIPGDQVPVYRALLVTVTHYCACAECCGKSDGITATGVRATPGVTVAVDPAVIPMGTVLTADYGDGIPHTYRAEDTGGAVKGARIDLFTGSHQEAMALGIRSAVVCWEVAP